MVIRYRYVVILTHLMGVIISKWCPSIDHVGFVRELTEGLLLTLGETVRWVWRAVILHAWELCSFVGDVSCVLPPLSGFESSLC